MRATVPDALEVPGTVNVIHRVVGSRFVPDQLRDHLVYLARPAASDGRGEDHRRQLSFQLLHDHLDLPQDLRDPNGFRRSSVCLTHVMVTGAHMGYNQDWLSREGCPT